MPVLRIRLQKTVVFSCHLHPNQRLFHQSIATWIGRSESRQGIDGSAIIRHRISPIATLVDCCMDVTGSPEPRSPVSAAPGIRRPHPRHGTHQWIPLPWSTWHKMLIYMEYSGSARTRTWGYGLTVYAITHCLSDGLKDLDQRHSIECGYLNPVRVQHSGLQLTEVLLFFRV